MKYIFIFMMIASVAFGAEFDFKGDVYIVGGYENDLDFNKKTQERDYYSSQQLTFGLDAHFSKIFITSNIQLNNSEGEDGNPQGSFDRNDIKVLDSYIQFNKTPDRYLRLGNQKIELPSATYGNPFFSGYAAAVKFGNKINEDTSFELFLLHPLTKNNGRPRDIRAVMVGGTLDMKRDKYNLTPYLTYTHLKHSRDSIFNWASAPNDSYSYVTTGGIALEYFISDQAKLKLDILYGDSNNSGPHHYESKGYHSATALEYKTSYCTPEVFAWYSSGNTSKLFTDEDYGVLPVINVDDGFAPTRLGFKGSLSGGRDSLISASGVGTKGYGFLVKDIKSIKNTTHIFRAAYIEGSSHEQGNGAPATVLMPGKVKIADIGMMTDKDYAVELNLDTAVTIKERFIAMINVGYICSGFNDERYRDDLFNLEMILKIIF